MTRPMPQPNENHRKLRALAGDWTGTETLSPSPWGPGGSATGKMSYRLDLDGFFLVGDYVEEKDGQVASVTATGWSGKTLCLQRPQRGSSRSLLRGMRFVAPQAAQGYSMRSSSSGVRIICACTSLPRRR